MKKLLPIASILASVVIAGFIVSIAFSAQADALIEKFLDEPGFIDKFKSEHEKGPKVKPAVSPLLTQAEQFALYINPPKPIIPKPRIPTQPRKPGRVSIPTPPDRSLTAKFNVIATSYSSDPAFSRALISEPSGNLKWVSQDSTVGHTLIQQIKDGEVIAKTGSNVETFKVAIPEQVSLLSKPGDNKVSAKPADNTPMPVSTGSRNVVDNNPRHRPAPPTTEAALEDRAAKISEYLKEMQASRNKDNPGASENPKSPMDLMKGLMEGMAASRVGEAEAEKLNDMGQKLDQNEKNNSVENTRAAAIRRRPPRRIIPKKRVTVRKAPKKTGDLQD